MPDPAKSTGEYPIPTLMLGGSPWAIRPDVLPRIADAANASRTAAWMAAAEGALAAAPKAARRPRGAARAGGAVAVLPLTGILTPRGSWLSMLFGGGLGGLQDFRDQFAEAVNSPDIGSIVIDVDSPGGLIDLVPEAAADVRAARGTKPIIAVANTMAASAAYWIATQADELVISPSGDVGSVGVYLVHEDYSGMDAQLGIATTYIYAGKYKVEGNPTEPLGEEAQAAWQEHVDDLYAMFIDDVAAGRGVSAEVVRDGYGEGRTLIAARAVEAGMADRIATIEDVIAEQLGSGGGGGASARAATTVPEAPVATAEPAAGDPHPEPAVDPPAPEAVPPALAADPDARARMASVLLA